MTWHHLSANWASLGPRLCSRFPRLDPAAFREPPRDRQALTRRLAESHGLTLLEAREELEDFLVLEALAREAELSPEFSPEIGPEISPEFRPEYTSE